MKLTALIPAFNDAYTLGFCLASIADHFDEIIVLDDCSTDETPDVCADVARRHAHVRYVRHEGRQLGWIEARNRLAALTDSDHLFWLDSDDVLCEYHAADLRRIAEGPSAVVRLRMVEMWGDVFHTTQRLHHVDRCHVYINRRRFKEVVWGGGTCAKPFPGAHVSGARTPVSLLFHLKGVKPDWRLVQRQHMRPYLRAKDRPASLEEFVGRLDPDEVHRRALKMLLHSRQDKLRPTYTGDVTCEAPESVKVRSEMLRAPTRPTVLLYRATLHVRFRIVYDSSGAPIDRVDSLEAAAS